MFGVFSCDICKVVHPIHKHKKLDEVETRRYIKQPNGISYDTYNIETIIAIARVCSKESALFRQFVITEICTIKRETPVTLFVSCGKGNYGIVEVHSVSHSLPMSDAKVAYGFDGRGKVMQQCRFGQNLPQTSLSVFSPKTLPQPATRLKSIRQREQATDGNQKIYRNGLQTKLNIGASSVSRFFLL